MRSRRTDRIGIEIKLLEKGDEPALENVAPEVFDDEIDAKRTREFLADPRHHLVVALDAGVVVGFVSAVHYVHPDKPAPELWINEVGVAPTHHRRGIGRAMIDEALETGSRLGCSEAWVLTEEGNHLARRFYAACGGSEEPERIMTYAFGLNSETGRPTSPDGS